MNFFFGCLGFGYYDSPDLRWLFERSRFRYVVYIYIYIVDGIPCIRWFRVILLYTVCKLDGTHRAGLSPGRPFSHLVFFLELKIDSSIGSEPSLRTGLLCYLYESYHAAYLRFSLHPVLNWCGPITNLAPQPARVLKNVNRIDSKSHSCMLGWHLLLWWIILLRTC